MFLPPLSKLEVTKFLDFLGTLGHFGIPDHDIAINNLRLEKIFLKSNLFAEKELSYTLQEAPGQLRLPFQSIRNRQNKFTFLHAKNYSKLV